MADCNDLSTEPTKSVSYWSLNMLELHYSEFHNLVYHCALLPYLHKSFHQHLTQSLPYNSTHNYPKCWHRGRFQGCSHWCQVHTHPCLQGETVMYQHLYVCGVKRDWSQWNRTHCLLAYVSFKWGRQSMKVSKVMNSSTCMLKYVFNTSNISDKSKYCENTESSVHTSQMIQLLIKAFTHLHKMVYLLPKFPPHSVWLGRTRRCH